MTIRLAVIGVGHLGKEHARVAASLPGATLVGVCDANGARAADIAGKWGAPAFEDFRKLDGKVDAVTVATPTQFHREVAAFFLERGIPCLVEKPLAPTPEDCEFLVALAKKKARRCRSGTSSGSIRPGRSRRPFSAARATSTPSGSRRFPSGPRTSTSCWTS